MLIVKKDDMASDQFSTPCNRTVTYSSLIQEMRIIFGMFMES